MRQYEYSVDGGTDHDGRNVYTVLCRSWDDFDQDAGVWTRVVGWYADRSVALREAEAFQENADEARDALRRENEAAGFTTHAPRGRGVGRMATETNHAITIREREILRHAVGKGHRNYYAASPGHHSYDDCVRLESLGLMGRHPPREWLPDTMFYVTEDGRRYL